MYCSKAETGRLSAALAGNKSDIEGAEQDALEI